MMRLLTPEKLNPLEVLQVMDYMEKNHANIHYTVQAGNGCIWAHWGSTVPVNLYFIFRDGKIRDVQVD